MAGHRVIDVSSMTGDAPILDPAAIAVIDGYLTDLAGRLPPHAPLAAEVVDELRMDLVEATESLASRYPTLTAAARAATTRFGGVDEVAAAFRPELAVRQARRIGLALLITGPLIGACWLVSLFVFSSGEGALWRWLPWAIAPVLLVGAPATAITVISSGRFGRWLQSPPALTEAAATVAGVAAGAGDIALLGGAAVLLLMPIPAPSPLVALAAAASMTRLIFITGTGIRALGVKRRLVAPPT